MDNANSPEYLEKIKNQVIENLKRTTFAPSVQMTDVPRDPEGMDDEADAMLDDLDEDENKDQRYTKRRWDKYVEKDGELSESEDEDENENNGVRRQPHHQKRRNIMDYQNPNAIPDDEEIANGTLTAERGRSRSRAEIGVASIQHATNGSANSTTSHQEESGASSPKSANGSLPSGDAIMQDADTEMVESHETAPPPAEEAQMAGEGPQEATPPDSPLLNPAAPVVPAQVLEEIGNDAMDEGDTLEDPEIAKETGVDERERENATAEKATELAGRSEQT